MLVAYAAISLVIVTTIVALADRHIQDNRRPRYFQTSSNNAGRRKNPWELTQLDCDYGCAWPHTSGPGRTLILKDEFRRQKSSD